MSPTTTRARSRGAATDRRRRAILEAALACFVRDGVEASSIEQVRRRAKASIGSIYHHFGSKEQLAAELYVEGLRSHQQAMLATLARRRDARRGIVGIVQHLLDWVRDHPDWARFLLTTRRAAFVAAVEDRIAAHNAELARGLGAWLRPHVESGAIARIELDLFIAIVAGPCLEYARRWLANPDPESLKRARRALAEAAWRAVRGETKED